MRGEIEDAKRRLPLPELMRRRGLGDHAKKSAPCPFHEDRHNSFSVWQTPSGSWRWKCFVGCGTGDEITLLEKLDGVSNKEAIKLFLDTAGIAQTSKGLPGQKANSQNTTPIDWQRCVDAFTEKHLERLGKWRGYSGEFCSDLHKAGFLGLWRKRVAGLWQNHIAFPVHDRARKVVAVHYLQKDDGSWRYYPQGAKVRPLIIGELIAGEAIHVFESQWDGYAFMDVSGERSGVIITRGASNGVLVAGLIPESSTVYLWTQNDEAGEKWQKDICANAKAMVKRTKIPASHKDLNDWTRAGATADDLVAAMTGAEAIREPEKQRLSESVADDSQTKRRPLTIRSIGEILTMSFDDADLILSNGYLALGERTAVCGMGGVGKSRLIMQLALCCRAGRVFLGWETRGHELKWLFLQTENSNRRLKFDLERMLTAFSPAEREAINAGVFFHTLEADDDGFLMLDLENSERIAAAIAATNANVVVFDPLRDFGSDDLNADKYMTETLREISRVTKRGNPKRIPLIIHHAGTGKAGIQKVTGFDRSSFGRNSKVLFSWVRAQINVAPGQADDNSTIIIASAKCSNAREFEPFAAQLDEATMLYQRDENFDFEAWRHSVESARGDTAKPTLEMVFEVLPASGSILKSVVIERMKDKGIGEKRARAFIGVNLTPSGPLHEWHMKRSGKRDEIHLGREPQNDVES